MIRPGRAGVMVARVVLVTLLVIGSSVLDAAARQYGWLGVRIRDLSEQEMDEISKKHGIGEGFGVYIVDVIDATPAALAGIKTGDVVVAFQGRPVTDGRLLQRLIASAPIENDIRMTVLRPEGRRQLGVRLATMPRPIVGERMAAEFGFILRDPETAGPSVERTTAPTISAVLRGSPAERAGLLPDDIVVEVNEHPVLTRDAAREALADSDPARPMTLVVRRAGARVQFTLPAPGP